MGIVFVLSDKRNRTPAIRWDGLYASIHNYKHMRLTTIEDLHLERLMMDYPLRVEYENGNPIGVLWETEEERKAVLDIAKHRLQDMKKFVRRKVKNALYFHTVQYLFADYVEVESYDNYRQRIINLFDAILEHKSKNELYIIKVIEYF